MPEQHYAFHFIDIADEEYREAIKFYVDNAGADIATDFVGEVNSALDIIEEYPRAGRPLDEIDGVRSTRVPKFPYRVYYRIDNNELEVIGLSIYHSKRDLDKLIPELKKRLQS